ncbi:MAG: hypothetical protein GX974_06945, partial [Clostridiales bacterium]|nr:hypothetical protein [Clostridiales bacterium]
KSTSDESRIKELARTLEKMKFGDYVKYLSDTRRMLIANFISGLARGFGMAIGFSVLGAMALYLLTKLANRNIPLIGTFITEIVKMVQDSL